MLAATLPLLGSHSGSVGVFSWASVLPQRREVPPSTPDLTRPPTPDPPSLSAGR